MALITEHTFETSSWDYMGTMPPSDSMYDSLCSFGIAAYWGLAFGEPHLSTSHELLSTPRYMQSLRGGSIQTGLSCRCAGVSHPGSLECPAGILLQSMRGISTKQFLLLSPECWSLSRHYWLQTANGGL